MVGNIFKAMKQQPNPAKFLSPDPLPFRPIDDFDSQEAREHEESGDKDEDVKSHSDAGNHSEPHSSNQCHGTSDK